MAIRDDQRAGLRNRATESYTLVPIAIGAVLVLLLGWWLFTGMTNESGMTRSSAPATNQSETNKTNSPGTSKQP